MAQDEGDSFVLPTLSIDASADDGLVPLLLGDRDQDRHAGGVHPAVDLHRHPGVAGAAPARHAGAVDRLRARLVPSPWGQDSRFAEFLIRGFDVGTYGVFRDGLGQKVIGFSGFNIEPYTLQRVEVLRGPNGVLYGETNPGGIVNAITKRPTFEPLRDGFVSYGSFDTVQAGFDVGGPSGPTRRWPSGGPASTATARRTSRTPRTTAR